MSHTTLYVYTKIYVSQTWISDLFPDDAVRALLDLLNGRKGRPGVRNHPEVFAWKMIPTQNNLTSRWPFNQDVPCSLTGMKPAPAVFQNLWWYHSRREKSWQYYLPNCLISCQIVLISRQNMQISCHGKKKVDNISWRDIPARKKSFFDPRNSRQVLNRLTLSRQMVSREKNARA